MAQKEFRLKDNLIDVYFQKSLRFLYPLVSPGLAFVPIQTYMAWKNVYKVEDNRLICLFSFSLDERFIQFEKKLFNHPLFEDFKEVENSNKAYISNLTPHLIDLTHFRNGRYSLLSAEVKKTILESYNANVCSKEYIDSYLNPEKYFERYAELLHIAEWRLKEVGELCNKYSLVEETLMLKEKGAKILKGNQFELF